MRRGLFLPIFDRLADPRLLADLAAEAEVAGWDGVFFWDHVIYRAPITAATDPWTAMALTAAATDRIVFGPMVTPLARRRPHVLARQVAALDQLSGGRFVLGVGLGMDSSGRELSRFGEETDDRRRAGMLDEALEVVTGLLAGGDVDHHGEHYTAEARFEPTPARPVPVWVAGRWPNKRPMARARRHDGVFLIDLPDPGALATAVADLDPPDGFEVIVCEESGGDPQRWADAGATWVLPWLDPFTTGPEDVRAAIHAASWAPQG